MFRIFFLFALIYSYSQADAQIDKFLKDKAKKALSSQKVRNTVKKKILSELEEARLEYDSNSFNYAIALSDQAGLFESKERFERQKRFLIEKAERREDDASDVDIARGWVDRAEMLYANNKYKLATGYLIAAKTIFETEEYTDNLHYARAIANLSLVTHSLGRLTHSLNFAEQALDLRKEILGEDSRGYAASLNNYALLKKDLGYYNDAEKLLNEAVARNKSILGDKSMPYVITLNNKAVLFHVLGRYDEAVSLLNEALTIAGDQMREKSTNYQRLQINLALLYQDMKKYDDAEKIYLNAIELKKKRLGENHPDYAHLLRNLAALYLEMDKPEQVEQLLIKSADIYKSRLGENSPSTASTYSDLGNFYRAEGRYDDAYPLLQSALRIRKNMLGEEHPDYIQSQEDLAIILWKRGEINQSISLYHEVMSKTLDFIDNYFMPMSESEKGKFWNKIRPRFQRYYSFVLDAHTDFPELLSAMYNNHIATKAILLNAGNKIKNTILTGTDEELKQIYNDWLDQKESLATYYTYSKEDLLEENINIDSLEKASNESEKYLSEHSALFNQGTQQNKIIFKDVQSVLTEDEAVVEIIHINRFSNRSTDEVLYAALVLTREKKYPQLVVLNNGNQLESRYYKYYNNAIKNKMEDEYSFKQFWQPINTSLGNKKELYVSMDGIYNQINLNTLYSPDEGYVVDKYNMTIVSNSRVLPELKEIINHTDNKTAFLLGYPNYGGDGKIVPLPGTLNEIENISKLLSVHKYKTSTALEDVASEQRIKQLQGENIIHIATHGFFLEDINNANSKVFGINTERASENALLRSGLLFSGAGFTVSGTTHEDLSGSNDGILTAFEAMNLSLDNTSLVVLSACETGRGDIKAGEGVYGLQRSFLVAGAEAIIMSLWKVDDEATQKLMTLFYSSWVRTNDIRKSFLQAQKLLKEEKSHPYYWGAFVLILK